MQRPAFMAGRFVLHAASLATHRLWLGASMARNEDATMPAIIAWILDRPAFAPVARVVLTFPFWFGGLARIWNFNAALDEIDQYGLHPAMQIACLVILFQLGGSLLVIMNRRTWSGAGALALFTLATIPVAHDFWNLRGHAAQAELDIVKEHIGLIGGLMLAAMVSRSSIYRGA
jgi:transmembrane protein